MEDTNIEENKRLLLIRMEYKTIEKLFTMHSKNQISTEVFKSKLSTHKNRLIECFKEISKIDSCIEEAKIKNKDKMIEFLICEYFLKNNLFKTADLYAKKHNLCINVDFYKKLQNIVEEIKNCNFSNALNFCKENRLNLKFLNANSKEIKGSDLEVKLRKHEFINLATNNKIKEAMCYVKEHFKKNQSEIKEYVPLLTDKNYKIEIETVDELSEIFKKTYLKLYKQTQVPRLVKRLGLGIMAYKTKLCGVKINPDCPSCLKIVEEIRNEVPCPKKDYSIILCKATGALVNEKNQPYAFENGFVYCEDYVKKLQYDSDENEIKEDDDMLNMVPKKCYFV